MHCPMCDSEPHRHWCPSLDNSSLECQEYKDGFFEGRTVNDTDAQGNKVDPQPSRQGEVYRLGFSKGRRIAKEQATQLNLHACALISL